MYKLGLSLGLLLLLLSGQAFADEPRILRMTPNDLSYMASQRDALDSLARRHFGGQLNGQLSNDVAVLQRLLDEKIVAPTDIRLLQGMGMVLGDLLKSQRGLRWVIYEDKLGRSRALQVPGFEKDVIVPSTQLSRKVEVGLSVSVAAVYRELEQSITAIRNKPPF